MQPDLDRIRGETILEIIREAEGYLGAQLACGIAADQRAATLSGALATLGTGMIGGGLAMISANQPNYALAAAGITAGIVMLVALGFAVHASRPVTFNYVGNCPANWMNEVDLYRPLNYSLWEQAQHYQKSIEENDATLQANATYLRRAFQCTFIAPAAGLFIGLVVWAGEVVDWGALAAWVA